MTSQAPQHRNHVADLLPAYVNGKLDNASAAHVYEHLLHCETCQLELSTWEAIKDTVQFATSSAPLPSASLLEQVWAKIDPVTEPPRRARFIAATADLSAPGESAPPLLHLLKPIITSLGTVVSRSTNEIKTDASAQPIVISQPIIGRAIAHLWLVLKNQVPIIHKSIWIASALLIFLACTLLLFDTWHSNKHLLDAELILSLITTVTSAVGVAFIYGMENDAGFEITLSTPTSIRLVMVCRLLLVLAYNFLLAGIASTIIGVVHGSGIWEIIQLWLGPMILLSSISLFLTLILGSAFAVLVSLLLEAAQALLLKFEHGIVSLQLAHSGLWQTNPIILCLAILFIVFALLYAPRQPRLSS